MTYAPYSSWTDAEKVTLSALLAEGWSNQQIAVYMKRSIGAVSGARKRVARAREYAARAGERSVRNARPALDEAPRRLGEVWTGRSGIKAIQLESGPVPFIAAIHADRARTDAARPQPPARTFSPG